MRQTSPSLLSILCLVLLADCSVPVSEPGAVAQGAGSAALSVILPRGLSASRVTITASAPGVTSAYLELKLSNGLWIGLLEHLPAGAHRSFLAQAYDASHVLILEGTTTGVTIPARQTTLVLVSLHAVDPPAASDAPRILSTSQSATTVFPGQRLDLQVVAEDPRGGGLSFSWTANAGTLDVPEDHPTTSHVTWTAPVCTSERVVVTLSVTNDRGLTTPQRFAMPPFPICHWASASALLSPCDATATLLLRSGKVLVPECSPTAEVYDPVSDTWSLTGPMVASRWNYTATLLSDGRVLVAGGIQGWTSLETAEVYDPASDTWSPTGVMSVPREGHTASLLPDGKVLVAGGDPSVTGSVGTAEVYDPASGTWSPTGFMGSARWRHRALPLPDGKVLVVGGASWVHHLPGTPSETMAEVYDPASGTWSPTGPMVLQRDSFAATPLPDGRVLVSGGRDSSDELTLVELYDPASNLWTVSSPMKLGHEMHTATLLLDGRVLVYGSSMMKWAELYDPASDTWSVAGSPGTRRTSHAATRLLDGRVFISGGSDSVDGDRPPSWLYIP